MRNWKIYIGDGDFVVVSGSSCEVINGIVILKGDEGTVSVWTLSNIQGIHEISQNN